MIFSFAPRITGIVLFILGCFTQRIPPVTSQDGNRDVRLVDGNSRTEGRIQIYSDGVWNVVCIEGWNNRAANVVCQSLGFGSADTSAGYISAGEMYKDVISVHCTGHESDLKQCRVSRNLDCNTVETAGVICKPFPDEGAIRLMDGLDPFGGRLEIFMDKQWGTVCDDHWDMPEMEVTCKQLGFGPPAVTNSQSNPFRVTEGTGEIHIDDVSCTGLENSLLECQFIREHNCQHHEDVVVLCQTPVEGMVRLYDSDNETEGMVQIYVNNQWGAICDIGWDAKESNVICRQLGFAGALTAVDGNGKTSGNTHLRDVQCAGPENELLECEYSVEQDCADGSPVRVACYSYADGDLRLMGSEHPYSGRIEVFLNGNWGTVCDDGWSIQAADVACKQLGMGPASSAPPRAHFGQGSGPVNMDNVRCDGSEENLIDCPFVNDTTINCGHDEDASVVCTTLSSGDARLVNGSQQNEGRIEFYLDGQWTGICVNDRTSQNGNVACRQLGYGTADRILVSSEFGIGPSTWNILDIFCFGNETSLNDCLVRDETFSNCTHSSPVLGVVCAMPEEGAVRLRGTNTSHEGRVEIFIDGEWGSICDDDWDLIEAQIVCHQLGFTRALEAVVAAHFGHGQDPTHLDNVGCIGHESNLLKCAHVTREKEDCLHTEDAGVICENTRRDVSQIRLVGGDGNYEGRLEVFKMGIWGTVCDNDWNMIDANVVCRHLGFEGAAATVRASQFGHARGEIHIRNPICSGLENSFFQCPEADATGAGCDHSQDVGVVCETAVSGEIRLAGRNATGGFIQIYLNGQWEGVCADSWDINDATVACRELGFDGVLGYLSIDGGYTTHIGRVRCTGVEDYLRSCMYEITDSCDQNGQAIAICQLEELPRVRLEGTYQSYTGRVEVYMNGQWGSICDDGWDLNDAEVVCRELGFSGAEAARRGSPYGDGYGNIQMTKVSCFGNEPLLATCGYRTIGLSTCNATAGVVCTEIEHGALRLVDGSNPQEGRVEVFLHGEWGTVCDDNWDYSDAAVVCRQLGIPGRASAVTGAFFGPGTGEIMMDNVKCLGSEQTLVECGYLDNSNHNCNHGEDAGVRCGAVEEDVTLRLSGGRSDSEGRVEVMIDGVWGTVCDDLWDINDAHVVCRQLGYPEALEALHQSTFGVKIAPILLDDVQCVGTESALTSCVHVGSSLENCNYNELAGVRCYSPASGMVRLTGEHETEGTVEIFLGNTWRNVCDSDWSLKDASVVCRQLGFGPPSTIYYPSTADWETQNHFYNPECLGNEPELMFCYQSNSSRDECHYVGVSCSEPQTGQLRLMNGNLTAGRVEVYLDGQWTTVCDDFWELEDATVVCRQLGFSGALSALRAAAFGRGVGRIGVDDLACSGSESRLIECRFTPYPRGNCNHGEDAGVVCVSEDDGDVRILTAGGNHLEGKVEVFLGGAWQMVCAEGWDILDASVVCKQLGFPGAARAVGGNVSQISWETFVMRTVDCSGEEASLVDCPFQVPTVCVDAAGITCLPFVKSGTLRVQGMNSSAGRVEMFYDGQWGTVCADGWDLADALVACNQLGFQEASIPQFNIGQVTEPYIISGISCRGSEESLLDCTHTSTQVCRPNQAAQVICYNHEGALRLVDGNKTAGRLEIFLNGQWGTVCDDLFGSVDAHVACLALGFKSSSGYASGAVFGEGTGPIHMDDVQCVGNEMSLLRCPHVASPYGNCGHSEDVGLSCKQADHGDVRIIQGTGSDTSGIVEIYLNGHWTMICNNGWDIADASIVCQQLGYKRAFEVMSLPSTEMFNGPFIDDVNCSVGSGALVSCQYRLLEEGQRCRAETYAGIQCILPTEGDLRLVGGTETSGRLEVFINNRWGTICDDGWNLAGATVACRQLGFSEAISTPGTDTFGEGQGVIQMDDVVCRGDETRLIDCSYRTSFEHNCAHTEDAGVVCGTSAPTVYTENIRLVGGNETAGRVEIILNGEWGTVCDDNWDLADAAVACRQLGFPGVISAPTNGAFGQGTDAIHLDDVACTGEETNLLDCTYQSRHNCYHFEDAGVVCQALADPTTVHGDIRIVNGNETAGRVEIYLNGVWGTVCDDFWDIQDAKVVCRQLGFPGAISAPRYAAFGWGSDPIHIDDVECTGEESSLISCPHVRFDNCAHQEDAGVVCQPRPGMASDGQTTTITGNIRLVHGSATAGRVEIYLDGTWGVVCDNLWDNTDALVVCRQLGFPGAISSTKYEVLEQNREIVHMDNVRCSGNENGLLFCSYTRVEDCGDREGAGVVCQANTGINPVGNSVIRLVNGNATAGRVEVNIDGVWGTVCDDFWDKADADVVCRQLGFPGAISAPRYAAFGQGSDPTHLDDVECTGEETNILQCSYTQDENCGHGEDAGVVCIPVSGPAEPTSTTTTMSSRVIRLVNGNETAGRVEVNIDGVWGTVCDDLWDLRDADVVCRQLGFPGAISAPKYAAFGRGSDPTHLDDVQCTGYETDILQCSYTRDENCAHSEDAGVVCTPVSGPTESTGTTTSTVRLVNGNATSGRVEIFLDGVWGTVCDDFWGIADAEVVCRQLGFPGAISAPGYAAFGQGSDPTHLDDVECTGDETDILQCGYTRDENCAHSEDAGVVCTPVSGPTESTGTTTTSVRLVNGNATSGRVEVYLDGMWGTVCDDLWDLEDAMVVCRQLGFPGAISAPGYAAFGQGSDPTHLDDVECTGEETDILQCSYTRDENCGHSEDAGVVCRAESVPAGNNAIRLVNGNATAGRVEVYIDGVWGTVCDDFWDTADATVVCRQLGFPGAISAQRYAAFGEGSDPIHLDDVECTGEETDLLSCTHTRRDNCVHSEDAGVVCISSENAAEELLPDGQLRLVNGNNTSGRVEIYLDGVWGTVCDDLWDLEDATVVCRQLGFPGAVSAPRYSAFGQGSDPTHLDDVECTGEETDILSCTHTRRENCGHSEDAGVVCSTETVRLVNGNATSGRVEVFADGVWGTVCDDYWDIQDAKVVCRQLGFPGAISAPRYAAFGEGSDPTHLDDVECTGEETNLLNCAHTRQENCGHNEDAGVVCATYHFIDVRLVNGNATSGRVEVYLDGVWGTVCDDFWDIADANVVCRQLGFPGAISAPRYAAFGEGSDPIHLDDVECTGEETALLSCTHTRIENCVHGEDAGVVCSPKSIIEAPTSQLRLVNGNSTAGRVEIYLDGVWGTVCDDYWDKADADVVCRQLGFPGAISAPRYAAFGQGSDPTHLDDVECSGDETDILQCSYTRYENCGHSEDAGVVCTPLEETVTEAHISQLRLVNGNSTAGRVEIYLDGVWGTVCDDYWDKADADVVCRQLGFLGAISARRYAAFGQGSDPTHLDDVECTGDETDILQCSYTRDENCGHSEDAGVVCTPLEETVTEAPVSQLRLVNGNSTAGRVEIYLDGVWGTVCDDFWDLSDAHVVCRQLGFPGAISAPRYAAFGQGSDPTHLDDVECTGDETDILQCSYTRDENCGHSEDAGVVCTPLEETVTVGNRVIRLVNGNATAGRVEVNIDGVWGTVCDDLWDLRDADVVCRQLGFPGAISAPRSAAFGRGSDPTHLDDVQCTGEETDILQCRYTPYENCNHFEDAGVVCTPLEETVTEVPVSQLRLVNGNSTAGRVEIYLDGVWGTVCDDLWDLSDANVVCRQLGFSRAISAPRYAAFGQGSDPTHLDDVECAGDETDILQCSFTRNENCGHSEDAGVVCTPLEETVTEAPLISQIRLVDGNSRAGRVEIYLDGVWGTVCDDLWDLEDAMVVCRQLGFPGAISAHRFAAFGEGSGPTHLDNVECTGEEMDILQCSYTRDEDCSHREDAGVVCTQLVTVGNRVIRLVNGNDTAGRVEVNIDGVWGTVCDDLWDLRDADVVCRQLGFPGAISAPRYAAFGRGSDPTHLDDVECTGEETDILQCSYTRDDNCDHSEDAGVVCSTDEVAEGDIRLSQGNSSAGRVEVFKDGVWGRVCDEHWDLLDAEVVCHQLGFRGALTATRNASVGMYRGTPLHLYDVECLGTESELLQCPYASSKDCGQGGEAGVVCLPHHSPTGEAGTDQPPSSFTCEPLVSPLCRGMPYNRTAFPNSVGHSTQEEAERDLNLTFQAVIPLGCPAAFFQFMCLQFMQPCDRSNIPCRELCETGLKGCLAIAEAAGFPIPPLDLDCSILPAEETRLCFAEDPSGVPYEKPATPPRNVTVQYLNTTTIEVSWAIPEVHYGTIRGYYVDVFANDTVDADASWSRYNVTSASQTSLLVHLQPGHVYNVQVTAYSLEYLGPESAAVIVRLEQEAVRLVNGNATSGRVEVYLDGVWGTVCDDLWDLEDATVVCRQLGFPGAISAHRYAAFGQGSDPIHLDDVECTGEETDLLSCTHTRVENCGHDEDAGVVCRTEAALEPPTPPRNVTVQYLNTTTIKVSWDIPEVHYGMIRGYYVDFFSNYTVDADASWSRYNVTSASQTSLLVHLQPGRVYDVQVMAYSLEYLGPESAIVIVNMEQEEAGTEQPPSSFTCEPLMSPLCRGMPYNRTAFPNSVGHSTQEEAERDLNLTFQAVIPLGCPAAFFQFMCLQFMQPCDRSNIPCRELCETGLKGCLAIAEAAGFPIPPLDLDCSVLPSEETRLCFAEDPSGVPYEEPATPPRNVTVQYLNTTTIEVSWAIPEVHYGTIRGYYVDVFANDTVDADASWSRYNVTSASQTSLLVHLQPGRVYNIQVIAYSLEYLGPESAAVIIHLEQEEPPTPPRNVTVQYLNTTTIEVSWAVPEVHYGMIRGYYVDVFSNYTVDADASWSRYNVTLASQTSLLVHLQPGRVYDVQVMAYSLEYLGPESAIVIVNMEQEEAGTEQPPSSFTCEPLVSSLCRGMPYNRTAFPNSVGHSTQEEAERDLNLTFQAVIPLGCPAAFFQFMCLQFMQPCDRSNIPCRELCETGLNGCLAIAEAAGFPIPPLDLDCSVLPSEETRLCFAEDPSGVPYEKPATPPRNVTVQYLNTTTIKVSWAIPEVHYGTIQGYYVDVFANDTVDADAWRSRYNVTSASQTSLLVHLQPGRVYDVQVTAYSLEYLGPSSAVVIVSLEQEVFGDLRLAEGNKISGRVEIFLNGSWEPVCGSNWDLRDATVVCHQLGFKGASAASSDTAINSGNKMTTLDDMDCFGSERLLIDCPYKTTNDCTLQEDAWVVCEPHEDGDLRLVEGNRTSGRVEIYRDGLWGTVCDDNWDLRDANIVCRQLGFKKAFAALRNAAFEPGDDPIHVDDLECIGTETSLLDCPHTSDHNCNHAEDAAVICLPYANGELRLRGGADQFSGRVEIYLDGLWGTVCDSSWDDDDATVVCRQLGYSSPIRAFQSGFFDVGAGLVLMDDTSCSGSEMRLVDCQYSQKFNCTNERSAGVACRQPANGEVRLVGGGAPNRGRVEVYLNDQWGTVCDDAWDIVDARIVCNQLGFSSAEDTHYDGTIPAAKGPIHIDETFCTGTEAALLECPYESGSDCTHDEDVTIVCSSLPIE